MKDFFMKDFFYIADIFAKLIMNIFYYTKYIDPIKIKIKIILLYYMYKLLYYRI